jgi:thioredoxin 1
VNQPVLVEFSAAWSRPCHIFDSVLCEVMQACAQRAKVVRVNADDNPELSLWYGIQSIPTLLYFFEGKVCGRIVGTATHEAVLARLNAVVHDADSGAQEPPHHESPKPKPT